MHRRTLFVAAAAGLLLVSCGPPETFNREQMLRDTADQVILSTHETLTERTGALTSAVETLCEGERASDELDAARTAWRELQGPLKEIRSWSFNMSPYAGSSFGVYAYRVDQEGTWSDNIEAVIAGDETYREDRLADGDEDPDDPFVGRDDKTIDKSFIADQDYHRNAKGYPAVEYLLFGEKDGTAMGELYASGENADRRCDYLMAADAHAAETFGAYVDAWARDGGNFAGRFDSPSPDDMEWTTVQDSIDAMVSQMVFVAKQRISNDLLGGPLGKNADNADGSPKPEAVSSPYANASVDQISSTLDGLEKLYAGAGGQSLADYTKFRKPKVHDLVRTRIAEARSAVEAIPTPLSEAVEEDTAKVEAAQEAVDELVAVIEADLKTTLGASTTRVVVDTD